MGCNAEKMAHGGQVLWQLRAPKRWRGEKAGQKPEKVAVFCEKVENYCAKVPLFSRVCSAKLTATLQ
jgi:hypothetical protein